MAESAVTSPLWIPYGSLGRERTNAGAAPGKAASETPAAAPARRNWRRLSERADMLGTLSRAARGHGDDPVTFDAVSDREAYLQTLLDQRCTRPEWFVADGDSSAVLWSLPGADVPSNVVLIETDWSDDALAAGRSLMARVHELAAGLGAHELGHTIDSPPVAPQHQEHPEARVRLLRETGYELVRDGLRWLLLSPQGDDGGPLTFRTIAEVGEDAFADAIAATFEGTPDAE